MPERPIEPPSIPDIELAIKAMEAEGKDPYVISMRTWRMLSPEQRTWNDYLVLTDETWKVWCER